MIDPKEQTLTATPGVTMHSLASDAYAPQYWVPDHCTQYNQYGCTNFVPGHYESSYQPSTDYRGNVTQITTYADAVTLGTPITETRTYDITGNEVTFSTSCCEQTSLNYTSATDFAYPEAKTRGSEKDAYAQVKTSVMFVRTE